jgi:hypothetical protein
LGGGTPVSSAAAKAFSFQSVAPTPLGSPITVIDLSSNAPTACFTTHSRTVMDYFRRFTFLFAAPSLIPTIWRGCVSIRSSRRWKNSLEASLIERGQRRQTPDWTDNPALRQLAQMISAALTRGDAAFQACSQSRW